MAHQEQSAKKETDFFQASFRQSIKRKRNY